MKNWFARRLTYPALMKRLWCQLALSHTLLAFCALTLLIVMIYGLNDYSDFRKAVTVANVEQRISSENLTLAQAIRETDDDAWWIQARSNIREKLTNIEYGSDTSIYRITNSSHPEVYLRIMDVNGRILMSDPADFPAMALRFSEKTTTPSTNGTGLSEDGPIWVDMPIRERGDQIIGHLQVLYIAEFDLWIQLRTILEFLLDILSSVLALSIPIGIACGLIAAHYVTRQLHKMNAVTESWRQGNFEARIALPNDDVLIRHSQHLNDMAQDLEMYLSLRQVLAVSEERNRVARELHDTVKQKLFALSLQLATAKTKPTVMETAGEHIQEAETLTREAQHDLMEILTQLRPTRTNATSLQDRITLIVDDFKRRFGIGIVVNYGETIHFNVHTEHHVPRIVQEALMNSIRHGMATHIAITTRVENDWAILKIADDGIGFDTNEKTQGFGITSMRDRVRDLPQGTLDIKSAAGIGTEITLTWKRDS